MPLSAKTVMRYLRPLLLILAVYFLYRVLGTMSLEQLLALAGSLSPWWVLAVIGCVLANFGFSALRYQTLVAPDKPFLMVLETIMASFLLNYASMIQGVGIGAKIGLMQANGIHSSRSVAGVVAEIGFDILFTCAVGLVFYLVSPYASQLQNKLPVSPGVMLAVAGVVLLMLLLLGRTTPWFGMLLHALKSYSQAGVLVRTLLSTAGVWGSAGLGMYFMLNSLEEINTASMFLCLVAVTLGFLTGLISLVPGGLGVRELTWAYILSLSGISLETAGFIALLYRLLSIALILLILPGWRYIERWQLRTS